MRAIGFNQGQLGDLCINIVVCRAFKQKYPNSHLTFGLNKKWATMAPIFWRNPYIDSVHVWDGYDNWPTEIDLDYLRKQNFDVVFNPMAKVIDNQWYTKHHHSIEFCRMHGLEPPDDLKVVLTPWFSKIPKYNKCVAMTCFTTGGSVRDIPIDTANKIASFIHSLGYNTIQLGMNNHPRINTTFKFEQRSIFEDVVIAYSCNMLFTADAGMNYVMSGYGQKVLGLYATSSWPIKAPIKHRIPVSDSAAYIEGDKISDIDFNLVCSRIKEMLCT